MQGFTLKQNKIFKFSTSILSRRGYILVETIVVVGLSAILILCSFNGLMNLCLKSNDIANDIYEFITKSRLNALYYKDDITVCPSKDGVSCYPQWKSLIIQKKSGKVLAKMPLPKDLIMHWDASLANTQEIKFIANGYSHSEQGTLYLCFADEYKWAKIVINFNGSVKVFYLNKDKPSFCDLVKLG